MERIAHVQIDGLAPLSCGAPISTPRASDETPDQHEERCWRERMHTIGDGRILIPPTAFSLSLCEAAKRMALVIPGKQRQTYTKFFQSGVRVYEPLILPVLAKDVEGQRRFVPADGVPGGSKRVWKRFPMIPKWGGLIRFHLLEPVISAEVFEQAGVYAGLAIGVGSFRPEKRGWWGTFRFTITKWE